MINTHNHFCRARISNISSRYISLVESEQVSRGSGLRVGPPNVLQRPRQTQQLSITPTLQQWSRGCMTIGTTCDWSIHSQHHARHTPLRPEPLAQHHTTVHPVHNLPRALARGPYDYVLRWMIRVGPRVERRQRSSKARARVAVGQGFAAMLAVVCAVWGLVARDKGVVRRVDKGHDPSAEDVRPEPGEGHCLHLTRGRDGHVVGNLDLVARDALVEIRWGRILPPGRCRVSRGGA